MRQILHATDHTYSPDWIKKKRKKNPINKNVINAFNKL